MSRPKPNLGEPFQIYSEVINVGKTVEGSKKRVRWLFGFTEKEKEIEVSLIHSITSGKKTIFEDGKEIVSSTNRLATDFGHTWRSESCQGRLFRVEFVTSFTTDPTLYTFTVDGIKFVDMLKKGGIGAGGVLRNRPINGFGTSSSVVEADAGYNNTAGNRNSGGNRNNTSRGFGTPSGSAAPAAPAAHTTTTSRRFIYEEDDTNDNNTAAAKATESTPAVEKPRGTFQSPYAPANNVFGFDPFDESPAPAPAAAQKQTNNTSLFDDFAEAPPAPKVVVKKNSGTFDAFGNDDFFNDSDPFGAAPPLATPVVTPTAAQRRGSFAPTPPPAPVTASRSVPNFMDDDFTSVAPPPVPASSDNFGFGAVNTTPQRHASANEISHDFAGMSFSAPVPAPLQLPQAAPLAPAPTSEPTAAANKDPWSESSLVNLDLSGSGSGATKRPSFTSDGPSLSYMMHAPNASRAPMMGAPAAQMMGGAQLGAAPMGGKTVGQRRTSFTADANVNPFNTPMNGMNNMGSANSNNHNAMGGLNGFGAPQPMGFGAPQPMQMGGMNNLRAGGNPYNAAAPAGGMNAMGGGMNNVNTRNNFISSNPTPGMGYSAPSSTPSAAKTSLDALDWNM